MWSVAEELPFKWLLDDVRFRRFIDGALRLFVRRTDI